MIRFITLLAFLLLAISCNNSSAPKPDEIAESFLNAYFTADFDRLLPLCGESLRVDLERSARAISSDSQQTLEKRRSDLAAYSYQITKVDVNRAKDSAFIAYLIFTPEASQGIESRLTLVREKGEKEQRSKGEREWKVAKLL